MENIKWSKKEVVERQLKVSRTYKERRMASYPIKVNVYRWKNYRLEKELYGENRLSYHIVEERQNVQALDRNSPDVDYYLCDDYGSYNVCFYKNIKEATRTLQYILENGLLGRQEWANPREEYVWGLLVPQKESF